MSAQHPERQAIYITLRTPMFSGQSLRRVPLLGSFNVAFLRFLLHPVPKRFGLLPLIVGLRCNTTAVHQYARQNSTTRGTRAGAVTSLVAARFNDAFDLSLSSLHEVRHNDHNRSALVIAGTQRSLDSSHVLPSCLLVLGDQGLAVRAVEHALVVLHQNNKTTTTVTPVKQNEPMPLSAVYLCAEPTLRGAYVRFALEAGRGTLLRGRPAPVRVCSPGAQGDLNAQRLQVVQDTIPRHVLICRTRHTHVESVSTYKPLRTTLVAVRSYRRPLWPD
jgi:hypothetical protein